jgi:beta-lactamase regulating signal transducer with metallopeptidase domain
VLLHELAHQRRGDGMSLLLGRGARRDCERACDDLVLGAGTRPSDYAEHLLQIASEMPQARLAPVGGLAILRRNQLEGRLRSILLPGVHRGLGYRAARTSPGARSPTTSSPAVRHARDGSVGARRRITSVSSTPLVF